MPYTLYESEIEQIALGTLRDDNGYLVLYGPDLTEGRLQERAYSDVILAERLRRAIESTLRASAEVPPIIRQAPEAYGLPGVRSQPAGDQRAGVVWHTQGSGKSLSMVFYAGKLILAEAMNNPTLVVLTDRNDLDQQLFETFSNCQQLLRQTPTQATSRDHLKKLLVVASGGVVFTTIQKFMPPDSGGPYPRLSDRHNIVVIADEAHRSQ